MKSPIRPGRTLLSTLILSALVACDQPPQPTAPEASIDGSASMMTGDSEVSAWLAELRNFTAPFHRIDVAAAAGWDTPLTDCLELPGVGGMGYHYGNVGLIDGVAEPLGPETLLYVPQKNGRLRLVGVEYLVPFAAVPADGPAPAIHGVDFHQNPAAGLWVLHAWIFAENPTGVFSDWNPAVSCEFAE